MSGTRTYLLEVYVQVEADKEETTATHATETVKQILQCAVGTTDDKGVHLLDFRVENAVDAENPVVWERAANGSLWGKNVYGKAAIHQRGDGLLNVHVQTPSGASHDRLGTFKESEEDMAKKWAEAMLAGV